MIPTIPPGPAWAVAIGLIFGGLAMLLKAAPPAIQAIRRNGMNGRADALGRQEAVAEIKAHIDDTSKEARERQDKIMSNIDTTRHVLAQPLQVMVGNLSLIEHLLEEIRDRLPRP